MGRTSPYWTFIPAFYVPGRSKYYTLLTGAGTRPQIPYGAADPDPVDPGTEDPTPVPYLTEWESAYKEWVKIESDYLSDHHWTTIPDGDGSPGDKALLCVYYDFMRVVYSMLEYFGPTVRPIADDALIEGVRAWRDYYPGPNNGFIPGYWAFSQGLVHHYLDKGDPTSKTVALQISDNAAYNRDTTNLQILASETRNRENAYALINHLEVMKLGRPMRSEVPTLVANAKHHIKQWIGDELDPNPVINDQTEELGPPAPAKYCRPFMALGLTSWALALYNERVGGDSEILPLLKAIADYCWDTCWVPANPAIQNSQAMTYTDRQTDEVASGAADMDRKPQPDLSLLICPVFAYLYRRDSTANQAKWRDRGDLLFQGGVPRYQSGPTGAPIGGAYFGHKDPSFNDFLGKHVNQNFLRSHYYVKWRRFGISSLPP